MVERGTSVGLGLAVERREDLEGRVRVREGKVGDVGEWMGAKVRGRATEGTGRRTRKKRYGELQRKVQE